MLKIVTAIVHIVIFFLVLWKLCIVITFRLVLSVFFIITLMCTDRRYLHFLRCRVFFKLYALLAINNLITLSILVFYLHTTNYK